MYPRLPGLLLPLAVVLLPQCPNKGRQTMEAAYKPRGARDHVLSRAFNEMAIGGDTERVDGYDPREEQRKRREAGDTGPDSFSGSRIEDLVITAAVPAGTPNGITAGNTDGTAVLRGYVYWPDSPPESPPVSPPIPQPDSGTPPGRGRVAIFFSGSGGSNASMAGIVASAYNRMGIPVVGVDYRGFGASNNRPPLPPLTGVTITEASLYQDGHTIYRYVREVMGIPAGDIILHGFSLGGAVAARIAADIARDAIPGSGTGNRAGGAGTGRYGREDLPGGLVLHSSIRTMTRAAAGTMPLPGPLALPLGWLGGRLTGGSYNTARYLRELAKSYPAIPIHFRGGGAGDDLSLERTRIDRIRGFRNATVYRGEEGHQSATPGSKQALNMSAGLEDIQRMLRTAQR
ncbi:MAG: alpha/beta hydrolase [Treponema sp.]|jgi:pimeloyl-ACP methyl ester carboxylesterase|nr:alpha/beta hydrolase [Treponema sp.]